MELTRELDEAKETFASGKTRSLSWRMSQLLAIKRLVKENMDEIFMVLNQDLGKRKVEAFRDEVGLLMKSVELHLQNMKKWAKPTKIDLPISGFPSSCELVQEPLGVILLLPSWNLPIGISLEPLIGAVSAGNAVVLKPSELAPSSSDFLARTVPKYLDHKAVKVIQGGPDIGEQLLKHKWAKIFFTGSARVGSIVMTAAAKHITPLVLELGGKCPAIIDSHLSNRDKNVTVERLVSGKWGVCSGQACIAVDYVLVEEKFASALIELIKAKLMKLSKEHENIGRIVNKLHFQRLSNLLEEPSVASCIVHGGSRDVSNLTIEPTILVDPPLNSKIMTEEIFGPLLPVITVKNIEESIDFINARPKPLVIYAFTNNKKLKQRIQNETSSGTLTFNDALIQYVVDTIPFGGVGESGYGKYHGKSTFDMFSHGKPVLRRSFLTEFSFRYPPWNDKKLELIKRLYEFDYFGFILVFLGLK